MPYKSRAQARAVMANTKPGNPRHREARAYAKAKLKKKRMGLPPRKTMGILAAMAFAGALAASLPAQATSGGTDRYGGHTPTEKSATEKHPAGVYHCHGKEGSLKRELCELRIKAQSFDADMEALRVQAEDAEAVAGALRADLSRLRGDLSDTRAELARANTAFKGANDLRREARAERNLAIRDMREAEARAAGVGPAVSARCKDGVHAALNTGWRFSSSEKEALRKACLY